MRKQTRGEMKMMNLSALTNEELTGLYTSTSIKLSTMQAMYGKAMREFGQDSEIAQYLWNEYVTADMAAQPIMVEKSQRMMREQMEHITPEEWASIVD